ncbi:MAG: hypothetical protein II054_05125, partial [Treponema sp.]|nr:hypothetical protein [Treponema sp.]
MEEYYKIPFIDLQWFAPEDEGKTEEPSEHKLRKLREEGRVAKSQPRSTRRFAPSPKRWTSAT